MNSSFKKEKESLSLQYFLDAYETITGVFIVDIEQSERPDFICQLRDGDKIGIELTKVRRSHPKEIQCDLIINGLKYMSHEDAVNLINQAAVLKETKRLQKNWQYSDKTILVIELVDIPLNSIVGSLEYNENLPDVVDTNFLEFWIVDYTGIEAYNNIELFCVFPSVRHGYYERPFQKPYG